MKYISKIIMLIMVALAFTVNSCVEPDDLITSNAKEGGLVYATGNLLLKAGAGQTLDIKLDIPKGPGIESVEIGKSYNQGDTLQSNSVVLQTVAVASANTADKFSTTFSVNYASLKEGLTLGTLAMPADEFGLGVGDLWTFTYTAIMSDGRRVLNNATTSIAVSNKYAGSYQCEGDFNHPNPASDRAISEEKFLTPVTATTCRTGLGDLFGDYGYEILLIVDETNSVTVTAGNADTPEVLMDAANHPCTYDPATGVFSVYYFYIGGDFGGETRRIITETYTPIPE